MPPADILFFRNLAYVFLAAALGGGAARLARQPLILGYVLGGILLSPFTPGSAVTDVHTFELFAEIGVILLMFFIGAEFSVQELLRLKWVGVLGGSLGILLITGLGVATAVPLGWRPLQGIIVGIVVSVASTLVLVRLLLDRGELHSRHGRVAIGITLVEDPAVVVLIILMPALGALEPGRFVAVGLALGKAAAILLPFAYLAAKVFPRLLARSPARGAGSCSSWRPSPSAWGWRPSRNGRGCPWPSAPSWPASSSAGRTTRTRRWPGSSHCATPS